MELRSLHRALTSWYDLAKRDLPWRRTRDPYNIWISEIMLQQTRVAAVIPYYERFIAAFPDAEALAREAEPQVLTLWSGLGYYSRARNLQKAAQQIVNAGAFPNRYDSILELAGVGEYTAAAVSSIAFGLPHAAVDGNIRRVIVRLLNRNDAEIQLEADRLLDRSDPGRWNQALMELGATVCLPRSPRCDACPLAEHCQARLHGTQAELPAKREKPSALRLEKTLLVIHRGKKLLLVPSSRVRGFWDFPERFGSVRLGKILGEFHHTITFRRYHFTIRKATMKKTVDGAIWWDPAQTSVIPLSTTTKKVLSVLSHRGAD